MNAQFYRTAGYVAILCGVAAIVTLVTTILFFSLEAPTIGTDTARTLVWGPLSDLTPIIQMALLLGVAYFLFQIQRIQFGRIEFAATRTRNVPPHVKGIEAARNRPIDK